eukprot:SAG22_NODE_11664_length_474_cov_4.632000_1_plen_60_part_00
MCQVFLQVVYPRPHQWLRAIAREQRPNLYNSHHLSALVQLRDGYNQVPNSTRVGRQTHT